jgi:TrmH family RNA methyltransferase
LRSGLEIGAVVASRSQAPVVREHFRGRNDLGVLEVEDNLFSRLSATEATQGVLTLVRIPEWSWDDLFRDQPLVVILDGLQDPGNAGNIARAAEAFGATGVVFLKGSVSPRNGKALRASAGSLFRVPFLTRVETYDLFEVLRRHGVELHVALACGDMEASNADLTRPCAIVIGSEGQGASPTLVRASRPLWIATSGVESLNAALAAGILLYEARRQRQNQGAAP